MNAVRSILGAVLAFVASLFLSVARGMYEAHGGLVGPQPLGVENPESVKALNDAGNNLFAALDSFSEAVVKAKAEQAEHDTAVELHTHAAAVAAARSQQSQDMQQNAIKAMQHIGLLFHVPETAPETPAAPVEETQAPATEEAAAS